MSLIIDRKISPLLASLLCHLMVANGFAAGVPNYSTNLFIKHKTVSLELDLAHPELKNNMVEMATKSDEAKPKKVNDRIVPTPRIQPVEADQAALLKKRMELDERIKTIRAKLKRTVKKQQLKRAADAQKGFQILSLEKGGPEWEAYLHQIRAKVLECWYPKLVASENQLVKSEVQLNFEIFLDGRIKSLEVVQWKGSEGFKKLSLDAFREAMPFAPFQTNAVTHKKPKSFLLTLFFYYQ